jgi:DNA-binding Lrp family transcriptional regulator
MIEPSTMHIRLTDDLDEDILEYVTREGEATMREITYLTGRPRSTVMMRVLKLQAAGLLRSTRYGNRLIVLPSTTRADIDG